MATTSPQSKSPSRLLDEWFVLEFAQIIGTKHGNAPPVTSQVLDDLSDQDLRVLISRLEAVAKLPPK